MHPHAHTLPSIHPSTRWSARALLEASPPSPGPWTMLAAPSWCALCCYSELQCQSHADQGMEVMPSRVKAKPTWIAHQLPSADLTLDCKQSRARCVNMDRTSAALCSRGQLMLMMFMSSCPLLLLGLRGLVITLHLAANTSGVCRYRG